MTDATAIADRYLEAYSETDAARRLRLISEVWSTDGRLVDPPIDGEGHTGISSVADAVQAQFPDHAFRRTSDVDEHHGYLRFTWELVGPKGQASLGGTDFGELDGDGRLRRVVGFLDAVPAA